MCVCVCHVNLRQFILDSHFAHINMHVNVNGEIALVFVHCATHAICAIFFFLFVAFFLARTTDELLCHLLFLWYSIFYAARNFNCFTFSFICCSISSSIVLLQQKQLETKKSRSLTRVLFAFEFVFFVIRPEPLSTASPSNFIPLLVLFLSLSIRTKFAFRCEWARNRLQLLAAVAP